MVGARVVSVDQNLDPIDIVNGVIGIGKGDAFAMSARRTGQKRERRTH